MADTPAAADERPILNIIGKRVALGPQRSDLVSRTRQWLNDFAVMAPLGAPLRGVTDEEAARIFEESEAARDQVWFTLYEAATLRPIGITGLRDIDQAHRRAEFVILIGEKDCWGKGFGTETARLMLDFGFHALSLHNVMLRVWETNERGIGAYRRAGFREIGRIRQARRQGGRAVDVVLMDCVGTEFESPVVRAMLDGGAHGG